MQEKYLPQKKSLVWNTMIFQGVFTVFLAISAKELVTMTRVFHKVLRGGGEFLPSWGEGGGDFSGGRIFLSDGGNLRRSYFGHSSNQHSVNIQHQLKPKLEWPVCKKKHKCCYFVERVLNFGGKNKNLVGVV